MKKDLLLISLLWGCSQLLLVHVEKIDPQVEALFESFHRASMNFDESSSEEEFDSLRGLNVKMKKTLDTGLLKERGLAQHSLWGGENFINILISNPTYVFCTKAYDKSKYVNEEDIMRLLEEDFSEKEDLTSILKFRSTRGFRNIVHKSIEKCRFSLLLLLLEKFRRWPDLKEVVDKRDIADYSPFEFLVVAYNNEEELLRENFDSFKKNIGKIVEEFVGQGFSSEGLVELVGSISESEELSTLEESPLRMQVMLEILSSILYSYSNAGAFDDVKEVVKLVKELRELSASAAERESSYGRGSMIGEVKKKISRIVSELKKLKMVKRDEGVFLTDELAREEAAVALMIMDKDARKKLEIKHLEALYSFAGSCDPFTFLFRYADRGMVSEDRIFEFLDRDRARYFYRNKDGKGIIELAALGGHFKFASRVLENLPGEEDKRKLFGTEKESVDLMFAVLSAHSGVENRADKEKLFKLLWSREQYRKVFPHDRGYKVLSVCSELEENESLFEFLCDKLGHVDLTESYNGDGRTPLMNAALNGDRVLCEKLLRLGEKAHHQLEQKEKKDSRTALFFAVEGGDRETFAFLLSQSDAARARGEGESLLSSIDGSGRTLLIHAILKKKPASDSGICEEILRLLEKMQGSASEPKKKQIHDYIKAKDVSGRTALIMAAEYGDEKVAEKLLSLSKSLNSDAKCCANMADQFGETALMKAAKNGNYNICKMLLDNGADIDSQDGMGYTALHVAALNLHEDVIDLLLSRGAKIIVAALANNLTPTSIARSFLRFNDDESIERIVSKLEKKEEEQKWLAMEV